MKKSHVNYGFVSMTDRSTEPLSADIGRLSLTLDGGGYPVSGWVDSQSDSEPFGPDTHLNLDHRYTGGIFVRAAATEAQAERARAREAGAKQRYSRLLLPPSRS